MVWSASDVMLPLTIPIIRDAYSKGRRCPSVIRWHAARPRSTLSLVPTSRIYIQRNNTAHPNPGLSACQPHQRTRYLPDIHFNEPNIMSAITNTLHKTDDNSANSERPNEHTREVLGSEPNVTGTDRPAPKGGEFVTATHAQGHQEQQQQQQQQPGGDQPRISRGHHHPRRPVGATGLPPNHK